MQRDFESFWVAKPSCADMVFTFPLQKCSAGKLPVHLHGKKAAEKNSRSFCMVKSQRGIILGSFARQKGGAEKLLVHLHSKKPAEKNSRLICHFSSIVFPAPISSAGRMTHVAVMSLPNIKIWFCKPPMAYGCCKYTHFFRIMS